MRTLRTITLSTVFISIILSLGTQLCQAQEATGKRRQIVGGEKWVWDPIIRQWVYHQGTRTVKANRGSNALPKNSYFDGGSQGKEGSAATANSVSPRRRIVGGEKLVWDPVSKQWVLHQGTRTISANRGINALPPSRYGAPKTNGISSVPRSSTSAHRRTTSRWAPPVAPAKQPVVSKKKSVAPPAKRVMTNPYVK